MKTPALQRAFNGRRSNSAGRGDSLKKSFQQIRELIVRGRLSPGSRIVEVELAQRLGVSRTPVRGALHWLQREGYILSTSGNGGKARLTVAPLTKEDARELYRIVGQLEGLAASSTAELEPQVRTEVVQKLKRINQGLKELAETHHRDPNRIFDLDMSFHQTIVDASAGSRLRSLHNSIKPQTERYWRLYASSILDELSLSVAEHVRIIEGIERGDSQAAEVAIQTNWRNGAERLCKVIDAFGERGSW